MALKDNTLRLSNSEMRTWRRCKRKWYLGVYRGFRPMERDFGRPTGLGTRVHDCLSLLYDPRIEDFHPLEWIRYQQRLDIAKHPTYEDAIDTDADMAYIMIEGYLQWLEETGNDADLRLIAPEAVMEVPLFIAETGEQVNLLSKIDARVERDHDGVRFSLEHKTVQSLTAPLPLLQIDSQLLTEHLVEFLTLRAETSDEEAQQRRAGGVLYNMFRKVKRTANAKPPFYGREEVRHNIDELRNHWHHVAAQANEILEAHRRLDAGESHHAVCYPAPGATCTWECEFFRVCAMMDDGVSDTTMAFTDLYREGDHLERYSEETPFDKYLRMQEAESSDGTILAEHEGGSSD